MALTVCPECNGTVSDRATICPHCGFPIATESTDYSKIVFQGKTIDIGPVIRRLHDENDATLAEFELIDAYGRAAIPYSEDDTKAMMKLVIRNYRQVYGELPSCVLESRPRVSVPHCPTCGSANVERIGAGTRAAATVLFGLASNTARKQMVCKNCGYKF